MQSRTETVSAQKGIFFSISGGKFKNLMLVGVLATSAFNMVMYADMAITGVPLDIPDVLGQLAVGESQYANAVGNAIHLGNGIGLSLLFGYVILPISKKIAKVPTIITGIIFATVELIIAVWFGMLPALGTGIAGLNIAPEVPIMTLLRHIVFGMVLGVSVRRWND